MPLLRPCLKFFPLTLAPICCLSDGRGFKNTWHLTQEILHTARHSSVAFSRSDCVRNWIEINRELCDARDMRLRAKRLCCTQTQGGGFQSTSRGLVKAARSKKRFCLRTLEVQDRDPPPRPVIKCSVGLHASFVEIHSYEDSVMSDSNLESNIQRFIDF